MSVADLGDAGAVRGAGVSGDDGVASEPPKRRGRRPAGEDTRGAIVAAARAQFAEKGYDATTLRGIARVAGVDPRLVHHYFASREELFVAAMNLPDVPQRLVGRIMDGPSEQLGERLVRQFFGLWDADPDRRQTIAGLISVATSGSDGATMFRQFLTDAVLRRLAAACELDDPELRASLVASQMMGAAMLRYSLGIEPLASADIEDLVVLIGPTIQRYLTG